MSAEPAPAPPRAVRVVRAVAASTIATLVALASHLGAGGAPPPLLLVAAVTVLSWLPAVTLIGRRPSLPGQAVVIGLSQLALHAVFSLGVTPPPGADAGAAAPMPGMAGMPGMAPLEGALVAAVPQSGLMWGAHALAAVATVVAWNRGEAALRSIRAVLRMAVRLLLGFRLPQPVGLRRPHPTALAPQPALHLRHRPVLALRRGPPLRTTS